MKSDNGNAASREPIDFPSRHPLGSQLEEFQEQLLCPICQELFLNPEVLLCGHSFCALCIRRHCDPMINRATANACPICRAKADTFDLRKNTTLAIVVEHFRGLRKDLADALTNAESGVVVSNSSSAAASEAGKRHMTGSGKEITGRLSQFNLHGLSKDKVKKIIEQATKDSRVKLRLEGDKDALERRLKDLVHLHNAQIGAINPLTLDQVIEKINVQSIVMEKEQLKANKTVGSVEKLKNGQETVEIANNFKKLAQLAKKAKKKTTARQETVNVETTDEEAAAAAPEAPMMQETETSRLPSRMLEAEAGQRTQSTSNADDWTWLDQVPLAVRQDWQIVFSKKLQRPFFFHLVTKTGQFGVPDSFDVYRGALAVPSTVSQSAVRAETVDGSESQEPVRRSGRRQSAKNGSQEEAMTKIATTSSSTPPEDDGLTASSSQRSRRSQSAKRRSPSTSSTAAVAPSSSSSSSSSSSRESALLFTASPDETVRTSLEEEERLFLTADSQDTTGSDDFLLTDDGTPTPPPSTTRVTTSSSSASAVLGRRSTVVVIGSNAPAAAAVPSTADVAPTALDDVEMIDMTQLPEASPVKPTTATTVTATAAAAAALPPHRELFSPSRLPSNSRATIASALSRRPPVVVSSAEKTQLDAELLSQRRDADHDAGSVSSVMLIDDTGEGDDDAMSPSQPRRKAPRIEDAPVGSPGVASLPSGAQSPASQRRRRGASSAEAASLSQTLSQSQATTPAGSHSSDNNGGGQWACTVCTYVNAQPRAKCEVCDSANPSFLNLASRPKRAASTSTMTPTAPSGASFSYNADALRRMQQLSSSASTASQSSSKKRKLQQSSITSALSK